MRHAWVTQVDFRVSALADLHFLLRSGEAPASLDRYARSVRAALGDRSLMAALLTDGAVASWTGTPEDLGRAADRLPEELLGVPIRGILRSVANALVAASQVDASEITTARERVARGGLERVRSGLAPRLQEAVQFICEVYGIAVPDETVPCTLVADGVLLGALTGLGLDDRPACVVAVRPHEGTTLYEQVLHELTHAIDELTPSATSPFARLRELGDERWGQVWHVPIFLTAAEAVRRTIDPSHGDYGHTHGYYAKVPAAFDVVAPYWSRRLAGELSIDSAITSICDLARRS